MKISYYDYMRNKERCLVCGEKKFFSTQENGLIIKLECGVCDAVYVKNKIYANFYLQEKMEKEEQKKLELRMYFFVPYNISDIQKAIQAGHSSLEYAYHFGDTKLFIDFIENHKTWIILNGGTTNDGVDSEGFAVGSINQIVDVLEASIVNFAYFREPDLNDAITAVCFICDERVWNYSDYPDFGDYIVNVKMYKEAKDAMPVENFDLFLNSDNESIKESFPEWYKEWEELMGGEENILLRQLIKNKKLA
ncbi:MAG: hypothetical protein ACOC22_01580 [bacterium]